MHGRWRLFRHDAGRVSGPPPWAYVALFSACLLIGLWSADTFDAVVIWPANGVMLAALLQLRGRQAIGVLATCLAINLMGNVVRGDPMPFLWLNAVMNLAQVCLAGLIARRVCGAALDLRRPRRLANFALLAVAPAVFLSAIVMLSVAHAVHSYSLIKFLFTLHRYFEMEALGLLIVAPALLLIAKSHRFRRSAPASSLETVALMTLLAGVTVATFAQSMMPIAFVIFPVLVLVAFRLSPSWVAGAVIMLAVIGGTATVTGHGPASLMRLPPVAGLESVPDVIRHLNLYYLFLLMVILTALPISTVMSSRRRLIQRLEARTLTAQTARRRAERADAAKSRFLALMSHEMRTPLNSVTGYAEVLARRPDMAADARAHLGQIQRSGDALLMLVEDVLEVSRGDDTLVAEPFCLTEVITASAGPGRILAEDKGLSLTIEVRPAAVTPVLGDRRRLRQALHHLIDNAVKFTERGGVSIVADRIGGDLLIAVADTGCGVDPALAPTLFEAFVQGDDSISRCHVGAGVGLTLVRRNARLMGGEVTVNSRPGQGATFTLQIPAPLAEVVAGDVARALIPATGDADGRPPRVLVVDDHPANREVARLMLAAVGCEVVEAADGDEAIDIAGAQAFDLILMDVRMPRVDGLTATRAIRALAGPGARVPILAVTADAMPEDAARCIAAGMDAHLAKPISHHALYAAMERLLTTAEPADIVAA